MRAGSTVEQFRNITFVWTYSRVSAFSNTKGAYINPMYWHKGWYTLFPIALSVFITGTKNCRMQFMSTTAIPKLSGGTWSHTDTVYDILHTWYICTYTLRQLTVQSVIMEYLRVASFIMLRTLQQWPAAYREFTSCKVGCLSLVLHNNNPSSVARPWFLWVQIRHKRINYIHSRWEEGEWVILKVV